MIMEVWTRLIAKAVATAVVLTGNCFVCIAGAPPAAAARPIAGAAVEQCVNERTAPPPAYHVADSGPRLADHGRPAGGECPFSVEHNQQPAKSEAGAAPRNTQLIDHPTVQDSKTHLDVSSAASATEAPIRAGPIFSASKLVGTTIKKE